MTKLLCAWCGTGIERPGYNQDLDGHTSHGMCPACSRALAVQENGVPLQRHIDSIPVPILVVDSQNTVIAGNAKAAEILGQRLDGPPARPPFGLVFDCVHSHLPEGCGRAIHCTGCVIRKNVAATFNTGEPHVSVPATLSVDSPDHPSETVFHITTVKGDGMVLMRIESTRPAPNRNQSS